MGESPRLSLIAVSLIGVVVCVASEAEFAKQKTANERKRSSTKLGETASMRETEKYEIEQRHRARLFHQRP
jgi:hypothetical protein